MLWVSAITLSTNTHSLTCRSSASARKCRTPDAEDEWGFDSAQHYSLQSGWEDEKRDRRALQDADHRNERWETKCRIMAVSQNVMTFLPRKHCRASFYWFCLVVAPSQRHFGENPRGINDVQKICCLGRRLWCLKCCLGCRTRGFKTEPICKMCIERHSQTGTRTTQRI